MAAVTIRVRGGEIIVVVNVTVGARVYLAGGGQLMRTKQWPTRGRMVEYYVGPQRRVVAVRTIGCSKRRARSRVRRIVGLLPSRKVAARITAVGRLNLQIVVVVDVAVGAGIHLAGGGQLVGIRQREARRAVIKIGRRPGNGSMAGGAGGYGKHGGRCRVLWIRGLLPGRQMALRIAAVRGSNLQIVIVVDMAGGARNIGVPIRERETRCAVVERGSQPAIEGMARVASLRESCGNVVWIGRFLKIRQVARIAGRGQTQVLPDRGALMAILALDRGVSPQQRKPVLVVF